jgi:hypothetical protein
MRHCFGKAKKTTSNNRRKAKQKENQNLNEEKEKSCTPKNEFFKTYGLFQEFNNA